MKHIITILFLCLFAFSAAAQKPQRPLSEADRTFAWGMRYLNGINTDIDYPKALERFNYLAAQGDARGINALAGMYRQGMGVAEDKAKARKLYAQASSMGFAKASYNLARMYKTAQGGEQDFKKALELAQLTLDQGEKQAYYMLGYMHYKGLGTRQDYEKAVEYFALGTELNQIASMYFLGLCYLGGYGVEPDITKGKQLIQRAAENGHDHAVEFIVDESLEKYDNPANIDPQGKTYPACRRTAGYTPRNISGNWAGRMLQYDFGGQRVIEDSNLQLQISDENNKLTGSWLHADSVAMELNAVRSGSNFKAENMQYMRTWNRTYEIRSLHFWQTVSEKGDTTMYALVERFSPQTMEPGAPVMLELQRVKPSAAIVETGRAPSLQANDFRVYPNPFLNDLTVEFIAPQAGQYSIMMYDLAGRLVRSVNVETHGRASLQSDVISKTIDTTDLQAATYAVKVQGKGVNLTTLVIKPVYW
jgi:hypothetical protein